MKRAIKWIAAGLAAVFVLAGLYGAVIEPRLRLDESHHEVAIPHLGPELEGTTIAIFSDLQVGMWWANHGMVARIAERAVELQPDAVLLPGDFLYGKSPDAAVQIATVIDLLAPLLGDDLPVFAVLGNHDYAADAVDPLTQALEQQGIDVLQNRATRLGLTGSEATDLHIVGIGARQPRADRPEEAFAQLPETAPRVVMMHNPATFPEIEQGHAPYAIAGHTHCGQIAIPGLPAWSYLELRSEERVVADGFAPADYGAEGNQLFVTCGIGFSLVPMRLSAPPELVVLELTADASASSPS